MTSRTGPIVCICNPFQPRITWFKVPKVQLVSHTLFTAGNPHQQNSSAEISARRQNSCRCHLMAEGAQHVDTKLCMVLRFIWFTDVFFPFISDISLSIHLQTYPSWHMPLIFPNTVIRDRHSLIFCVIFFIVSLENARLTAIGLQVLSLSTEPFLPFEFCTSTICTYLTSLKPVSVHGS